MVDVYFIICRIINVWFPMGTHQMAGISKIASKTLYKIDNIHKLPY